MPHELPAFDALWDYDDPAATEAQFRAILPAAERSDDRAYHAELLTQIARTRALQRDFDGAHAMLDAADAMMAAGHDRARVRSLLERGRTLNSSRRADEARPLFAGAWDRARAGGHDGLAVDAAHMLAIVEKDESLSWNEKALALAEASEDPDARRWRGSLHNNIGWAYHERGDHERALAAFEAALACRRAEGKAADVRVARWCVARCLRSLGRIDDALAIQRELEPEIAALDDPDGYVYEELAECLLARGDEAEARPYFRRAHELLSRDPWLAEAEPERLARLKEKRG